MTRLTDVLVPPNGEGTRATVLRWCKAVGDAVVKDEPLVELETDKVTVEIPAPVSGTLIEVLKPVNAEVSIKPSIPMLTTPVRSEQIPASAPSVIGVALVIVMARIEIVAAGPNCAPVSVSRMMPMTIQKPIWSHRRSRD